MLHHSAMITICLVRAQREQIQSFTLCSVFISEQTLTSELHEAQQPFSALNRNHRVRPESNCDLITAARMSPLCLINT